MCSTSAIPAGAPTRELTRSLAQRLIRFGQTSRCREDAPCALAVRAVFGLPAEQRPYLELDGIVDDVDVHVGDDVAELVDVFMAPGAGRRRGHRVVHAMLIAVALARDDDEPLSQIGHRTRVRVTDGLLEQVLLRPGSGQCLVARERRRLEVRDHRRRLDLDLVGPHGHLFQHR